ncbi:hypothetical protein OG874_15280 [Nocardia sp. NBC_00565]|uniref:hypothetical protein n=1 Tax=Nocardia sp. NBC_00565 TaxID=2975993 RepID=UPI002E7FC566|nr:hypothetical protein [Nocardia sp. NBC_00565]WUC08360.1 hypothetical protein OG874_15280 [Nocardia sp. NBC_00565]
MEITTKFWTVRRVVVATLISIALVMVTIASPHLFAASAGPRDSHSPGGGHGYGSGSRPNSSDHSQQNGGYGYGVRSKSDNHDQYRGRNENPCQYTPTGTCGAR